MIELNHRFLLGVLLVCALLMFVYIAVNTQVPKTQGIYQGEVVQKDRPLKGKMGVNYYCTVRLDNGPEVRVGGCYPDIYWTGDRVTVVKNKLGDNYFYMIQVTQLQRNN